MGFGCLSTLTDVSLDAIKSRVLIDGMNRRKNKVARLRDSGTFKKGTVPSYFLKSIVSHHVTSHVLRLKTWRVTLMYVVILCYYRGASSVLAHIDIHHLPVRPISREPIVST